MKTIINRYETRGRVFTIVKDQGHFLAIEDKYIGKDGRLTQGLNGCQMHAARDLNMCLELTDHACWMDDLLGLGCSKAEAFCIVNNCECTAAVRELFGEAL